ncbi:beta-Ig-H3/fasciclin [Streptomyces mexicanus]|uniref:Beta-Ig-H3/fasciclin n=2 Tax=Streptomyces mexicanus TaxID=178566 RepID=A0A7X1I037_9ACTN|nr:beta-Ig-H3/fasciclin [Streptomyces mexicanus]MBC2866061.1 beta-Ig-H3/fasciclin [Streptomyces mexicanus]
MGMRATGVAVVTAAVLGGALAATAPAASAAPAAPAAGGTAPACISRYVTGTVNGFDVLLTNNCGKTMRVKVVVKYASDSPCYTLRAGADKLYTYEGITGEYDRTAVC